MAAAHRTALINQIRGFLLEYGIERPEGAGNVRYKPLGRKQTDVVVGFWI
ncbi:MAG: hypothetical protein HQL72_14185 [Magnetococcales bacterium]|nr:hypothetical protein [Magnetococcales bacterium]